MCEIVTAHEIVLRRGWLSLTPQSFQRDVLDRCFLVRFEAGEFIYVVGDPPGGMFGLVSGGVSVSIAPGERGPYFAHFARPGTWMGEAAAITGQSRRVGLSATRDTELLHLPLQEIREIVEKNPEAWRLFALITIGHLDMAIGASDDLMIRDHVKRCVAVLLRLGCLLYTSNKAFGSTRTMCNTPANIELEVMTTSRFCQITRRGTNSCRDRNGSSPRRSPCYQRPNPSRRLCRFGRK